MTDVLLNLTKRYESILSDPNYAFGLATHFVTTLLALPPNERYELLSLFKRIENDAFEKGIELPNLKYEELEKEKTVWDETSKTTTKKGINKPTGEDDFNNVFFSFFSKYEYFLQKIKGYFVFRL